MRVLITSLCQRHRVNPVVQRMFQPLHEFRPAMIDNCEAIFLSFIAPPQDFQLDRVLLDRIVSRGVPVVIFDHEETLGENFLLGIGSMHDESPYAPVHKAVRSLNVAAYFKRELRVGFESPLRCPLYPLDWTIPAYATHSATDSRDQFNARPIDIFMSWGYSSESRPRMHGELLRTANRFAAHFSMTGDDVDDALKEKRERIFALLFTPHTRRIGMEHLLRWQKLSKITLSLKGCGMKCFRTAEASHNSLIAQQAPETVHWSYPWVDGVNCIALPNGDDGEIDEVRARELLYEKLRVTQGSLYDIYLGSIANSKNYHMGVYARNYLLPKLKAVLA